MSNINVKKAFALLKSKEYGKIKCDKFNNGFVVNLQLSKNESLSKIKEISATFIIMGDMVEDEYDVSVELWDQKLILYLMDLSKIEKV